MNSSEIGTPCGLVVTKDQIGETPIIDHKRVKYISFLQQQFYKKDPVADDGSDPRVAYIADTENHCIRQLSVQQAYVSTVAGVCGSPGHVDGPFTQNKLNRPELVGVDAEGYIFIYDAGN